MTETQVESFVSEFFRELAMRCASKWGHACAIDRSEYGHAVRPASTDPLPGWRRVAVVERLSDAEAAEIASRKPRPPIERVVTPPFEDDPDMGAAKRVATARAGGEAVPMRVLEFFSPATPQATAELPLLAKMAVDAPLEPPQAKRVQRSLFD